MKKNLILGVVMALSLVACNQPAADKAKDTKVESASIKIEEGARLPIAVVDIDSLLNNYTLAIEANEALIKKQEDARLDLNQRAKSLQNEMVEFQKKLENQAFLSRERAESEQRRLLKKQDDLQLLGQQKEQDFMIEQQNLSIRIQDSINSVINHINADGRYHLIVTTSSLNNNILYSNPSYDITSEVLDKLNERYK